MPIASGNIASDNWVAPDKFDPAASDDKTRPAGSESQQPVQPLVRLPFRSLNLPAMPKQSQSTAPAAEPDARAWTAVKPEPPEEDKRKTDNAEPSPDAQDNQPFSLNSDGWETPKNFKPKSTTEPVAAPLPPPSPKIVNRLGRNFNLPWLPGRSSRVIPTETGDDSSEVNDNKWMSLDRYNDKKHEAPADQPRKDEAKAPETVSVEAQPAPKQENITAIPALPDRPLVFPSLPGLNNGLEVRVDTTDGDRDNASPPIIDAASQPEFGLAGSKWEDAGTKAREAAAGEHAVPLNIRMTRLPEAKVKPSKAAAATKKPYSPLEAKAQEKSSVANSSDEQTLAAIKAYKKRQLDAIESDRKTLSDLQAAIDKLGLDKKLDTGNNGK